MKDFKRNGNRFTTTHPVLGEILVVAFTDETPSALVDKFETIITEGLLEASRWEKEVGRLGIKNS